MRILVTGLNGIIGWNLFGEASARYPTTGTYRQWHPRLEGLRVYKLEMDVPGHLRGFLEEIQPEVLIHAWAMCDLDLCEEIPEMAEKINIEGARLMLEAAKGIPSLKRFVYISTDHVFDGEKGSYSEEDQPCPKHVYGRTKYEAEKRVQASGLPFAIIRPGLVIGESLQGRKGPKDFLLTRTRAAKPTHYFTDEWRSPIPAPLMASRVLEIALSAEQGIFHVAGEEVISRYDLARRIVMENGFAADHVHPRLRKEDRWASIRPKNLSLRTSRLRSGAYTH